MEAVEALYLLRRLGLSLAVNEGRLDVSPADLLDEDVVWLLRTHKAAIIAELKNDAPAWAWSVNHGTHSTETYHHPERTRNQVLLAYPDAVSVERLPEYLWPIDPNKIRPAYGGKDTARAPHRPMQSRQPSRLERACSNLKPRAIEKTRVFQSAPGGGEKLKAMTFQNVREDQRQR